MGTGNPPVGGAQAPVRKTPETTMKDRQKKTRSEVPARDAAPAPPPAEAKKRSPAAAEKPAPGAGKKAGNPESTRPDPTRYGDWEKKGRCIDF